MSWGMQDWFHQLLAATTSRETAKSFEIPQEHFLLHWVARLEFYEKTTLTPLFFLFGWRTASAALQRLATFQSQLTVDGSLENNIIPDGGGGAYDLTSCIFARRCAGDALWCLIKSFALFKWEA